MWRTLGITPEQLLAVLEDAQDAVFVIDSSGYVLYMNRAAIEMFGCDDDYGAGNQNFDLQGHLLDGLEMRTLDGASVARDDQPLVRALRGEEYRDVELLVQRAGDANPRAYVFSGRRIEGDPPLSVLSVQDETDRWRAERRYRAVFEVDPAPSLVARLADLRILQANMGMADLTGLDKDTLENILLTELEPLRGDDVLFEIVERLRTGESAYKLQRLLLREDETDVHVLVSARAIEFEGAECGIFTFVDITELETAKRERAAALDQLITTLHEKAAMTELATTDPLTGIANRHELSSRLSEEISRAERYGNAFCVLLLDLDHFKEINDAYGHHVGDLVLVGVAHLLHAECREPDLAGRWGGEEFMMILSQTDITKATNIASRVRNHVTNENAVGPGELTISIGVASFEPDDTEESLFKKVDRALYAAKEKGRDRVEVADADQADA